MSQQDIKTVAVIGAGDMGHGIAEVALLAGYEVWLQDVADEFVNRGKTRITDSLKKLMEKGRVEADLYESVLSGSLKTTTEIGAAAAASDLVIEAIPENMDLKKATFGELDKAAPAHTILASNTSTMSITEIATSTNRPGQVIGLHYFNPAVIMKLVEVIRGEKSSDESIEAGYDFCLKCKKVPVRVNKDVPGFIVNRSTAPRNVLLGCIVGHGIAEPEEVDAMMKAVGMPMGPFELRDFTGIDVGVSVCSYFAEAIHPDYAPPKDLLEKYEAGNLGKKSGQGYYDWSEGRPKIDAAKTNPNFDPYDVFAVQINEATKLIEMGVCTAEDFDVAVMNALGFARGPMAIAREDMSPEDLISRLERMAKDFGKVIFEPTATIREGAYL